MAKDLCLAQVGIVGALGVIDEKGAIIFQQQAVFGPVRGLPFGQIS